MKSTGGVHNNPKILVSRLDYKQRRVHTDCFSILRDYLNYCPRLISLDFIHQFHGLDDANNLSFFDLISDLDKGWLARCRSSVKVSSHGAFERRKR